MHHWNRAKETRYRGCRFRSRIEARWAVFFDTLGIKWWYEPEGFSLRFDYEAYAADMVAFHKILYQEAGAYEKRLRAEEELARKFRHLDGKEYSYLPDFYLPELNYWIEVKGFNPTREEIEKAFMLQRMAFEAGREMISETQTESERRSGWNDLGRLGVFIIYGDIPWPFPQKGNMFGYRDLDSTGSPFPWTTLVDFGTDEPVRKEPEYRSLLTGQIKLCWQECPLCLRIGVGTLGEPYCLFCQGQIAQHIWDHLASYKVISEAGTQDTSDQVFVPDPETWVLTKLQNPANLKAIQLIKDLINPEFFTSGHKTPKLQAAYSAARSARFEHGESP
jgi:hypothetical protein